MIIFHIVTLGKMIYLAIKNKSWVKKGEEEKVEKNESSE